jgi:VanZ family protein
MALALIAGARGIAQVNAVPPLAHKVEHLFYYGGMAALLAWAFGRRRLWYAVPVVSLVGVVDEWHQLSIVGRHGSAFDWLVDTLGAAVAVYACHRVLESMQRRRHASATQPRA